MVREAACEVERTAAQAGVELEPDQAERVLAVGAATAANRSSMLQDIDAGRRTELDALNGALCREADRLGVAAPTNRMLFRLVRALERARGSKIED